MEQYFTELFYNPFSSVTLSTQLIFIGSSSFALSSVVMSILE